MQNLNHQTFSEVLTAFSAVETEAHWYAVWTRNNCEQRVCEELADKGFKPFLPELDDGVRHEKMTRLAREPLFPGYVFIRHAINRWSYLKVCKTRGVLKVLGTSWDCLAAVPDEEIDAIRRVQRAGLPRRRYPFIRDGERVRVTRGPLANIKGILVVTNGGSDLLVLSIGLLRQSVAVEIDRRHVMPA
jgi:transcription antitermination factor NusG